jgi:hypothetical protein
MVAVMGENERLERLGEPAWLSGLLQPDPWSWKMWSRILYICIRSMAGINKTPFYPLFLLFADRTGGERIGSTMSGLVSRPSNC